MKIFLKKKNPSDYEMTITRSDDTTEIITLNTNTFFLHDVCHYVVESELKLKDGFWGMLAQGYKPEELKGKTNSLTEKLRLIECIVGGVQSVFSKHKTEEAFWNYIKSVDIEIDNKNFLDDVIPKVEEIINRWKYLPAGSSIELAFFI